MKQICLLSYTVFALLLFSCNSTRKTTTDADNNNIVEVDTLFCKMLMANQGIGGVTGGDGSISIDLKDGRTLFMWGDSFLGDVKEDGSRSDSAVIVVGNVFTTIDQNNNVKHYYNGTPSKPLSVIEADPVGNYMTWYWPGHGFVRDDVLHIFMAKLYKTGDQTFDFVYDGCDYFTLDVKDFKILSKTHFDPTDENGVHYGHAVLDEGKYIYNYGSIVDKETWVSDVHVMRCQLEDGKLGKYEYWDGEKWQKDSRKSKKIEGITQSVSEQFNVIKLDNKYVFVTQGRVDNNDKIYSFISDDPTGPFRNETLLYTIHEPTMQQDSMFIYNAMVHPSYIKDDKILMCYNVNTYDFYNHYKKASLYHPRFMWVPLDMILNEE